MMNSENASKKVVQSLIDLVSMAKWLMYENQQPFVTQELARLFPNIRGRWRRDKSSELFRVGAVINLLRQLIQIILVLQHGLSTTRRMIEKIWESKAASKKPRKSMSHKTTSGKTPSNFAILSPVKPSDFRFGTWFMSFLKFDLPRL